METGLMLHIQPGAEGQGNCNATASSSDCNSAVAGAVTTTTLLNPLHHHPQATTATTSPTSSFTASINSSSAVSESTAVAEDDVDTMKPPPPIKAKARRHSKQLPRLLLQHVRATTGSSSSTMATTKHPPCHNNNNNTSSNNSSDPNQWPLSTITEQSCSTSTTTTTVTTNSPTRTTATPLVVAPPPPPCLCSALPDDLICKATSFLDVRSLLEVRRCSRYLRELASRNEAGWHGLCANLWATKVHVPPELLLAHKNKNDNDNPTTTTTKSVTQTENSRNDDDVQSSFYMDAYQRSIRDATERQHVTLEELCYDPVTHTGTIWSFRFKESAGADWTNADPWYSGLPCRKMVFLKDGSVRQYISAAGNNNNNRDTKSSVTTTTTTTRPASSSSTSGSDSESSLPELISPNFGNLQQQQQQPQAAENNNQQNHRHNGRLVQPPMSMSWRFLTRPMDLPTRPLGSYVRFSVGGREVPTYSIRRSPTGNWGFLMESCWGLYASFELPPKRSFRQQQLHMQQRRRLRRTEAGAMWVDVMDNGEETLAPEQLQQLHLHRSRHYWGGSSLSPSAQHHHQQQQDDAALDDTALIITNEIQWREAFLYNVGARVLPEGDNATNEFDRASRGIP